MSVALRALLEALEFILFVIVYFGAPALLVWKIGGKK